MLMLTEAVLSSIIALMVLLFLKSKPPHPPSISAGEDRSSFKDAIRSLLRNQSYLLLFFAFSMGLGTFNAMATMVQPLVTDYGFSSVSFLSSSM